MPSSKAEGESTSEGYVEGLSDTRTMFGKRRISARLGRVGEKGDFFSILSEKNDAGYCEALPILVQQRPYAVMRFIVGAPFSERRARHPIGLTN